MAGRDVVTGPGLDKASVLTGEMKGPLPLPESKYGKEQSWLESRVQVGFSSMIDQ